MITLAAIEGPFFAAGTGNADKASGLELLLADKRRQLRLQLGHERQSRGVRILAPRCFPRDDSDGDKVTRTRE
jgi:hypothetical protein